MRRRIAAALAVATLLTLIATPIEARLTFCERKPWHPRCVLPTPTPAPTATPTPTATPSETPPPPPNGTLMRGASIYHKRLEDLDLAVAGGLNSVRIVNWLDESPGGNAFDTGRWALVDQLVAGARARGLRVILDLSTYRNQLLAKGTNAYTVDWRPMLDFIAARHYDVDWLALAGEPEAPNGGASNRPTSTQLSGFYQTAAAYWKSISSVPVESGGLLHYGWDSGIDWQAIFTATGSCAVHVYSEGDITALPAMDDWCDAQGFPFLLEEFGRPQDIGDTTRAAYFARIAGIASDAGMDLLFWNLGPETYGASHDVNPQTPATWSQVQSWAN